MIPASISEKSSEPHGAPACLLHSTPTVNAYVLRIELADFNPVIYREVLIDPTITLRKLHAVIQAAMAWTNSHWYAFARPLCAANTFWKTPNDRKWQKPDPEG